MDIHVFQCLPHNGTETYMDRFSISTAMHPFMLSPVTIDACKETSNVAKTHHTSLTQGGGVDSTDEQE